MRLPLLLILLLAPASAQDRPDDPEWSARIRPLLARYCLDCHSTKDRKGDLDLERFRTLDDVRKDLRPWAQVPGQLLTGEMPPKKSPKPSDAERRDLADWTRSFLAAETRARAGDPGRVLLRRLSNVQYDHTIRDLTGVDLALTKDFPADGAAGEGFTNVGDALVTSPALVGKYLGAAKEAAGHLVLLPDGFRFSPSKTRRDWTDEAVAALQREYRAFGKDGAPPLRAYLLATIRHRAAFEPDAIAAREGLSAKYLRLLWDALRDTEPSYPLDLVRKAWAAASEKDVDGLVALVASHQKALWRHHKIGSYGGGRTVRAEPLSPAVVAVQSIRVQPKAPPGEDAVVLHLNALGLPDAGPVAWRSPRFEDPKGEVLKLEDYATWGPRFEIELKAAFARTAAVLAELDGGPASGLPPAWVERWRTLVGDPRVLAPATPVERLDTAVPENPKHPGLRGWRSGANELPVVLANGSAVEHRIPGRASPGKVVVHPLPDRFVAVEWAGAAAGPLRVSPRISHAHGGCGNGIAWRLELRRGGQAARLDEGTVGPGATAAIPARETAVQAGDTLLLVVDPRDGSHVCDLTEVDLKVEELEGARRSWTLSSDVSSTIASANPCGAWSFVHGPTTGPGGAARFPSESLLGRWRSTPAKRAELAPRVEALLCGPRPSDAKAPDRILYDLLAHVDGPLFRGLDAALLPRSGARFGPESPVKLRLPAAIFREHAFVVEPVLEGDPGRAVQFSVSSEHPRSVDPKIPVLATGAAGAELLRGLDSFRSLFPPFACYPRVIPDDEVVCLKLYHREDEPLKRLFLDEAQAARLDRLWEELDQISRWPVTEHQNLPLFIGFVTQDGGAEAVKYFESLRAPFKERAAAFEKRLEAAWPSHVDALVRFAALAWRRPLDADAEAGLRGMYAALRKTETPHEETVKRVFARILTSPAFLFRIEETRAGAGAQPLDAWELASRLSYMLWASLPDAELRARAADGRLLDPAVLEAQAARMLKDTKSRGLASEFAAQWLHVRGIRSNREKNERLFPEFDAALRDALYEEVVLNFQHFFREGRPLEELTDSDATHLNERLAAHYGIPGVKGPEWRRVEGVRAHGRGAVFSLGAVLTQHSGASRTSPVLRGNWVAEILLGDKLPKPPANVPQLPEDEGGEGLSVREMTLRHTRVPECASCHVRIDPFGFALEGYDAIGRRRDKDGSGKPVDARVELRDGTRFEGSDGLRSYLATRRKDVRRTFLRKFLGYALGRSVSLSDEPLIESLDRDGLTSAEAVRGIILSPQFRRHRALEATRGE